MPERAASASGASQTDRDVVQSVVRGLAVVRAFGAEHPALTLDEAAERSGVSRSAARRLLRTLMAAGLASFDGHHYRLTPRLLDLGYAQQSRLTLAEVALPHCSALSRALGRTVSVARLDGTDVVYVARVGTSRLVDISLGVGSRFPAHRPAIGRVLLAWLPEDELAAYLASEAYRSRRARTLQSTRELRQHLLEVRGRGWCLVLEELDAGLSALAAPVHDRTGRVVAAINISTHLDERVPGQRLVDAVPALLRTAAQIGADLHPSHLA